MPTFVSFGSLFMVIGQPTVTVGQGMRALGGALMLSFGLVTLLLKLGNLEKEIDKLKEQTNARA